MRIPAGTHNTRKQDALEILTPHSLNIEGAVDLEGQSLMGSVLRYNVVKKRWSKSPKSFSQPSGDVSIKLKSSDGVERRWRSKPTPSR
jgi:hypothetical protein